jgi:serine/threonine-protein kinase
VSHRRHQAQTQKVGLNVSKRELAAVHGADRFLQEITTTASLRQPHIRPLSIQGRQMVSSFT